MLQRLLLLLIQGALFVVLVLLAVSFVFGQPAPPTGGGRPGSGGSGPHALLSTTHTDTNPGAVQPGDGIVGNVVGGVTKWDRQPVGADQEWLAYGDKLGVGQVTTTGTVVTGTGTLFNGFFYPTTFTSDFQPGDQITVIPALNAAAAQTRTVATVGGPTSLTVTVAFSPNITKAPYTITRARGLTSALRGGPELFFYRSTGGNAQTYLAGSVTLPVRATPDFQPALIQTCSGNSNPNIYLLPLITSRKNAIGSLSYWVTHTHAVGDRCRLAIYDSIAPSFGDLRPEHLLWGQQQGGTSGGTCTVPQAPAVSPQCALAVKDTLGTTMQCNLGSNPIGHFNEIVVAFAWTPVAGTVTASDSLGNTYTQSVIATNGTNAEVRLFTALAATDIPTGTTFTVTFPSTSGPRAMHVLTIDGLAASPIDQTATGTGSGTAVASAATAATTAANELLIGAVGDADISTNALTFTGSWISAGGTGTAGPVTSDITLKDATQTVSATGTYSVTGTLGSAVPWAAAILTLKAGNRCSLSGAVCQTTADCGDQKIDATTCVPSVALVGTHGPEPYCQFDFAVVPPVPVYPGMVYWVALQCNTTTMANNPEFRAMAGTQTIGLVGYDPNMDAFQNSAFTTDIAYATAFPQTINGPLTTRTCFLGLNNMPYLGFVLNQ